MAVIETSEPTAAEQQKNAYNSNVGGLMNIDRTYSVPVSTSWAIVGTVLAAAVTKELIESDIIPDIVDLSQVTSVHGDAMSGPPPSGPLDGDEVKLYVTSKMVTMIGSGGDTFRNREYTDEFIKPTAGKRWCVFVLRVPLPLNDPKITALEAAITGVTGVLNTEHLVDGTISDRSSGNADLTIHAHARIETPQEV